MLRDALEFLYNKACVSKVPVDVGGEDPRQKAYVIDGNLTYIETPPAPRSHQVSTLQSFIDAVDNYQGTGGETQLSTVWHDHRRCVLMIDDHDRHDRVALPLLVADEYAWLCKISGEFTQREFIEALRHDLYGCVPDTLLPRVRKIEVATSGRRDSEINPGRERGTSEFQAELAESASLPEKVVVQSPVYNVAGLRQRYPIVHSLAFDLTAQTFDFRPLPGEIDRAMESATADLHAYLSDGVPEGVPVFAGTP